MPDPIVWTSFQELAPRAPWWVRRRELIAASPDRVWKALTEPAELNRWWCDDARIELVPGGTYTFVGPHVYGGSSLPQDGVTPTRCEVLALEHETSLKLRWPLGGVDTCVHWELENHLESTRLTVTQTAPGAPGWDPGSGPNWWWVALPNLRSHIEKGQADLRLNFAELRRATEIAFTAYFTTFPWIIWSKLTRPTEIRKWWSPCSTCEPRADGQFHLEPGQRGPTKILDAVEGERLTHDWQWGEGVASRITWLIEETTDDVVVRVQDHGPWPARLRREESGLYWAATLLALKQMSERGVAPREYQE